MDDAADTVLLLQEELETARAVEAESLRRANHLRAIGEYPELKEALRDVDHQHSTVSRLQGELRRRLDPKAPERG